MLTLRTTRIVACLAIALGVTLSACGGDDDPATDSTAPKDTTSTSADAATGAADVPEDICALISATEVGAVLGETVEAAAVPGGGCQYKGGTSASLYPTIAVDELSQASGGIAGAQSGAEGATGGTAESISVAGYDGYVVTGAQMGGSTGTQAAVGLDGLLVSVSLSGGDAASNEAVAIQLLELAVHAVDG